MKILHVNKFYFLKGGSEKYMFELARKSEAAGHKNMFFSMEDRRNVPSGYSGHFVSNVDFNEMTLARKLRTAPRVLYFFEARKKIEALIRRERPDITHLHNIAHQISPSILHSLRKYNIPAVQTLHDYKLICPTYYLFSNGMNCEKCKGGRYYNAVLSRCTKGSLAASLLNCAEMYAHRIMRVYDSIDFFIAPSRSVRDKMAEFGVDPARLVYLPHFIDSSAYTPDYGHSGHILYFGRLSPGKGLNTLIDAMKGLDRIRLKIIGEDPREKGLRERVAKERINNVEFLGYKAGEELKEEMGRAMFIVVPSVHYEIFGLVILEAFAMGKPVVGSDLFAIPELVRDGVTGLTFEPGNAEDLRAKIKYLADNPGKIVEMGKNARRFAENEMSFERHYLKLLEVYERAISLRGRKRTL